MLGLSWTLSECIQGSRNRIQMTSLVLTEVVLVTRDVISPSTVGIIYTTKSPGHSPNQIRPERTYNRSLLHSTSL